MSPGIRFPLSSMAVLLPFDLLVSAAVDDRDSTPSEPR